MSESRGRIPQEVINEIIDRADIVEVIGRYVPLKKQGQNYTGLCPFHNEKTPSFSVSPSKQIFHCFGCGIGGNVFKFLMEIEHLTFPEAVRKLADEVGVKIPEQEQSESNRRAMQKRNRLLKWNEFAAFYYQAVLHSNNGEIYRNYLDKRRLTEETINRFQLGGCLDGWSGLYTYLKKKGATDTDLLELGLVSARNNGNGCYDRFRERLIFPIKDANGHVVAFGGRIIDAEKAPQKYMNSPDSDIFHKGKMVYGLDMSKSDIRATDQVIIVEGYMDVIACHQAGISNCVAPLGTALTEDQIKLLMRYTYNFVTAFDGDSAGIRATMKSIDLIENAGGKVRILAIPDNKDPDEYIKAYGIEAFKQLLNGASNSYLFRLQQFQKQHPGDSIDVKLDILYDALPYLARMRHQAEIEVAIKNTAEQLFLSEQAIKTELNAYRRGKNRRERSYGSDAQFDMQDNRCMERYPKNEVTLLNGLVAFPDYCEKVELAGGVKLFQSPLCDIYQSFFKQYEQAKTIDASRLSVELSSLYAQACMKAENITETALRQEEIAGILERAIVELQYDLINKRYKVLLNKIGSLEKGGLSDDMEQALIELEAVRQKKTQVEDKMRGDKQ